MIAHPPYVGAAGFEPATSWSQTRRDDRTTLRPVLGFFISIFSSAYRSKRVQR
jgi:hypothetical protein